MGAGDINRIGATRVDWVAPVATGSCAQLPPGDGPARREQGGGAAQWVSTAEVGVGAHDGARVPVAIWERRN